MDANPIDPIREYAENLASLDQTAKTLRDHLNSKKPISISGYEYMVDYRGEPDAFEIRVEFMPSGVAIKTELLHNEVLTRAVDEGQYTDLLKQIHDRMFPRYGHMPPPPKPGEWYEATGRHNGKTMWYDTSSNGQQHIWDGNDWLPLGEDIQKATDEEVNEAIESIKQTLRARPDLLDGHQDS